AAAAARPCVGASSPWSFFRSTCSLGLTTDCRSVGKGTSQPGQVRPRTLVAISWTLRNSIGTIVSESEPSVGVGMAVMVRRLVALVLVGALAVAGCGDDDGAEPDPTTTVPGAETTDGAAPDGDPSTDADRT